MCDKELLELAAKAAGYEIEGDADKLVAQPGRYAGGFSILNDKGGSSLWNPLTDDGDALRLAHKLGLLSDVPVWPRTLEETRRAIVRAAAEIGKAQ